MWLLVIFLRNQSCYITQPSGTGGDSGSYSFSSFPLFFKALDARADGSLHEKQQVLLPVLARVFG